jgi:hypothetical protein
MSKATIIINFNAKVLMFANYLNGVCPDTVCTQDVKDLEKLIKTSDCALIDMFVLNVLPDKHKIESKDETFFTSTNNTYNTMKTGIQKDVLKKLFKFTAVWNSFTSGNKHITFATLQSLSSSAYDYYQVVKSE